VGRAAARADVSGDNEADPERLVALINALTGRGPRVYRRGGGRVEVVCYRERLEATLYRARGRRSEVARGDSPVVSGGCSMAPALCGLVFRKLVVFLFLSGRLLRRVV
jgi:hypothetical protein